MELQLENACPNCSRDITDNFCSNCGQKKYKRIDKKYIWDELQYTVFHWNKGLLYSIKQLIKNPGKTARTFVEGNRVNHYKPISLVFVLSGLGAFLSFKVLDFNSVMKEGFAADKNVNMEFMNKWMTFVTSYNAFIMLAVIPIIALLTKIAFRKWGHNYYEHIVMNAYGLSCYSALSMLLVYPILYFVRHDAKTFLTISNTVSAIIPITMVWFFKGFYPNRKLTTIILRILLIIAMVLIIFVLLIIVSAIVGAMLGYFKNIK